MFPARKTPAHDLGPAGPGGRARVRVRLTRYGLGYGLAMLGMLVGSANYNNNLGFALTFVLASMGLISVFHARANVLGLGVRFVRAEPVFAGQQALLVLQIKARVKNGRALECSFRSIDEPGAGKTAEGPGPVRLDLTRTREQGVTIPVLATTRGWLRPGPLLVSTVYPLGLFRVTAWYRTDAVCLVYPRPLPGPEQPGAGGAGQGQGTEAGPGVEDFRGVRRYEPGDSPRRIAWKHSSRGRGLYTKEFQGAVGRALILDFAALSGDAEYRLSRLAHMLLRAEAGEREYALVLAGPDRGPGKPPEPSRGEVHLREGLKALALYRTEAVNRSGDHE